MSGLLHFGVVQFRNLRMLRSSDIGSGTALVVPLAAWASRQKA